MRIDRVEPSRHKKGRLLVFLEDGACLKVTERELLSFHLRAGEDLTDEELLRLKEAAGISNLKETAAELVGRKPISRRDLERKLQEKGASAEEAMETAEWMEELGGIDDKAFASSIVRHYSAMGYGSARLREKLREKGIPREFWEEALEEAPDGAEKIDAFLRSKLRGERPDEKERRRLTAALLRRGYSWSEVRAGWGRLSLDEGMEYDEE